MKKTLTSNIGLKIISLFAACLLWILVVNTDDPMINRTYSGIPVEIINTEEITSEGKTFEVLDNSDTISVIVHAKRSIIEDMSRDYLRATADMKEMTATNNIPIEVRSSRFSDRIDTLTPVTRSVKVQIEELGEKRIRISAEATGVPAEGYVAGPATPSVNILTVSGPASIVEQIASAKAMVDVTGLKADISTTAAVNLYDENGEIVNGSMLKVDVTEVHVDAKIYETKVVPVSYGHIAGAPSDGYQITGAVTLSPDSVRVAGAGEAFRAMETLEIPADVLSVNGAAGNVVEEVNVSGYLPSGVSFADESFDGVVAVTIYVGNVTTKELSIPTVNISITNVPEGYTAVLVDIGGYKNVTVSGLADTVKNLDAGTVTGVINASAMVTDPAAVLQGSYNGEVSLNLPSGVSVTEPVTMEVLLTPISINALPGMEAPSIEALPEGAAVEGADLLPPINNQIDDPLVNGETQTQPET